eukprot:g3388.t1
MKYKSLGNTGLYVSELTLGTMTFDEQGGSYSERIGATGQDLATRMVDLAIDAGINIFDTANIYASGVSEEMLGKALGARRQDVLIATKLYNTMTHGANDLGSSRLAIMREVELSLKRLGTDYIDLYQVHNYDHTTPLEETMRALDDLVRQGKVRYIGLSNFTGWQIAKADGVSKYLGAEKFCSCQAYYSMVGRELEHDIIPACMDLGLGTLIWSPLAGGFLSGKYTRENAETGRRTNFSFPPVREKQGLNIIDKLTEIAEEKNASVPQVALAWLLHKPGVTSVIVGARKEEQLIDNLGAVDIELSADEMKQLDKVSAVMPSYPHYLVPLERGDTLFQRGEPNEDANGEMAIHAAAFISKDPDFRACVEEQSRDQVQRIEQLLETCRLGDDLGLDVRFVIDDVTSVKAGEKIAEFRGAPKQIAKAEERLIGMLAKPSGIATTTRKFVEAAGDDLRIVSGAWKKMPMVLKHVIRHAIRSAGADFRITRVNFVYLDKNFVRMLGGIRQTLIATSHIKDHEKVIQIKGQYDDVANEAIEAAEAGAHIVFIDTGDIDDIDRVSAALRAAGLRSQVILAYSGNVQLADIPALRQKDVDRIKLMIEQSALDTAVKTRALNIFGEVARAEATIHDMSVDSVHFHEVGATDSIVDIVGAAIGLEYLIAVEGVRYILSSPLELGSGKVKCAHGLYPVPAPATAEILQGAPSTRGGVRGEATTPTGAAIMKACAHAFIHQVRGTSLKTVYGIGHRDADIPNVVRVQLIQPEEAHLDAADVELSHAKIEANIDDMSPEAFEPLLERLFDAGASDAFLQPILMKKSRPAQMLSVLCRADLAESLERGQNVFATRATEAQYRAVLEVLPDAIFHELSGIIQHQVKPIEIEQLGKIAVVNAGTSDLPVAEEAALTAEFLGGQVLRISDVGVAGLHRLLARIDEIRSCQVIIVVAGMEGALPSVVAGLVDKPVIAVPTSVGYGAAFGGVAALLGKTTMNPELAEKYEHLKAEIRGYDSALVALSGGIDSSLVAFVAGQELGERALAITSGSESLKSADLKLAKEITSEWGLNHRVIKTREIENADYVKNLKNRCYFCKSTLYTDLAEIAEREGFRWVLNGTNTDDLGDYRPGLEAADENAVKSPLLDCGFSKQDIRDLAAHLNLRNAKKPAAACLSSRVPYGTAISSDLLRQIEQAEHVLDELGFEQFRVRHHGDVARLEVEPDAFMAVLEHRLEIERKFKQLGYRYVTLDLKGFRSGSMNEPAELIHERCADLPGMMALPVRELVPHMPKPIWSPRPEFGETDPEVIRRETREKISKVDWSKMEGGRAVHLVANPHGFSLMGEGYVAMLEAIKDYVSEKYGIKVKLRIAESMGPLANPDWIKTYQLEERFGDVENISQIGPGKKIDTILGDQYVCKKLFAAPFFIHTHVTEPRETYFHRMVDRLVKPFGMSYVRLETRSAYHFGFGPRTGQMIAKAVFESDFIQQKYVASVVLNTVSEGVASVEADNDLYALDDRMTRELLWNYGPLLRLLGAIDEVIPVFDGHGCFIYSMGGGITFSNLLYADTDFLDLDNLALSATSGKFGRDGLTMGNTDALKAIVINYMAGGVPIIPYLRDMPSVHIATETEARLLENDPSLSYIRDCSIVHNGLSEAISAAQEKSGCENLLAFDYTPGVFRVNEPMAQAAKVLSIAEDKVFVTDVREALVVLDVLEPKVEFESVVGRQQQVFDALAQIPGVSLDDNATIHSEGVLGVIGTTREQAAEMVEHAKRMDEQIRKYASGRVAVISTGTEVQNGEIKDTNYEAISKAFTAAKFEVSFGGIAGDTEREIAGLMARLAGEGYGLIISTGGVGAEDKDHTIEAVEGLDPNLSTAVLAKYKKGTGRHVKDSRDEE